MTPSSDPLHDEINLVRLLRRLDAPAIKDKRPELEAQRYITAQGTLQKVKFARRLLKNVELAEGDATPERAQLFDDFRSRLDEIEAAMKEVEQPAPPRPISILSTLPRPSPPRALTLDLPPISSPEGVPTATTEAAAVHTDDLLLPADTPSYPSSTSFVFPTPMPLLTPSLPLPPTTTAAHASTTGISAGLSNPSLRTSTSTALHQELSTQLQQMASQLKRNAIHLSESLAKDAAVVEETQTKVEGNFDLMSKGRLRIRDLKGKSRGTTCLTLTIVLAVLLLFVIMVGVIRFSRI
ncbi:hypothetical protein H0H87_008950 [Tephrocybe sp. NHM501043]|nr:hypothetical protein H0H87_008950 [Tephrocybe sp. NHM501043]